MRNKGALTNNFSRGWLVVAVSTIVLTGFYGAEIAFGVFLKPIIGEFGWTRAEASAGMSILQLVGGPAGFVAGLLADRYGARIAVVIGAIAAGAGYLLLSKTGALWQLYLYFGLIVGIAMAFVWVPVTALVASRFPQKRVMALGIATTGITIGQMTVPPLMAYYISSEGWRYSYVVLAIIIIITTIPAVLVLGSHSKQQAVVQNGGKETNRAPGGKEETPVQQHQWSAREAVRTVPFWMLLLNGFVIASGFYFVSTHIVAYATDIIPGTTSAPLILTFMGAASVCGKLTVSSIATKIGSRSTLFIILSLQALALFSFMQANSLWVLFVGGAIFGLGFGAASPVRMALVPELFGLRSVATIIGLVNVAWSVGGTVGPVLAGYAFDISQSYELAFLAGGLLMMSGLVATYFLRPIPVSAIRLPVNEE